MRAAQAAQHAQQAFQKAQMQAKSGGASAAQQAALAAQEAFQKAQNQALGGAAYPVWRWVPRWVLCVDVWVRGLWCVRMGGLGI